MYIFHFLILALCIAFPIVLWAYFFSYMAGTSLDRTRFFIGLIAGTLSGIGVYVLSTVHIAGLIDSTYWTIQGITTLVYILGIVALSYVLLYILGVSSTEKKRYILVNALLCGSAFLVLHILSTMLPQVYILAAVYTAISLYMLPAGLEEASKHIATVDSVDISTYHLPQVLLVAIYTALGFVYIENILYIYQIYMTGTIYDVVSSISLRSLFSLCAHIFATCIGAYFWYIASRYSIYSLRYVCTFLLGICTAILAHVVFNALLETQSMTLLLVYSAVAYTVVVRWLWIEEK